MDRCQESVSAGRASQARTASRRRRRVGALGRAPDGPKTAAAPARPRARRRDPRALGLDANRTRGGGCRRRRTRTDREVARLHGRRRCAALPLCRRPARRHGKARRGHPPGEARRGARRNRLRCWRCPPARPRPAGQDGRRRVAPPVRDAVVRRWDAARRLSGRDEAAPRRSDGRASARRYAPLTLPTPSFVTLMAVFIRPRKGSPVGKRHLLGAAAVVTALAGQTASASGDPVAAVKADLAKLQSDAATARATIVPAAQKVVSDAAAAKGSARAQAIAVMKPDLMQLRSDLKAARTQIWADRAQLRTDLAAAKGVNGARKELQPVVKSTRAAIWSDKTAIGSALK